MLIRQNADSSIPQEIDALFSKKRKKSGFHDIIYRGLKSVAKCRKREHIKKTVILYPRGSA